MKDQWTNGDRCPRCKQPKEKFNASIEKIASDKKLEIHKVAGF